VHLPDTIRRKLEAEGRLPALPVEERVTASALAQLRLGRVLRAGITVTRPDWPGALAGQCRAVGLPDPVREHVFHPVRRWRFDLAWVGELVACEVDGGGFMVRPCPHCGGPVRMGGRHSTGKGLREDCAKLSEAAGLGWRVLRVTPDQVKDGHAVAWLTRALAV